MLVFPPMLCQAQYYYPKLTETIALEQKSYGKKTLTIFTDSAYKIVAHRDTVIRFCHEMKASLLLKTLRENKRKKDILIEKHKNNWDLQILTKELIDLGKCSVIQLSSKQFAEKIVIGYYHKGSEKGQAYYVNNHELMNFPDLRTEEF